MPWVSISKTKRRLKHPLTWAAVAALACAALLALPKVQARYRGWTERRGIQRAVQAYNRGDFKQAVVDARGVLDKNPHSPEATRIVAKSLEALQLPQAVSWRRGLDALQAGDAENLLGLAKACFTSGDFDGADRVLQRMKPEDQKSARFHDLTAKIAERRRDPAAAESHWQEALRIEPENAEYRLGLASVQLDSRVPETRAAAIRALEKMTETPAQRIVALRALLADATTHHESARRRELAETLAADPAAEFSDKIARLAILRLAKDPESTACLAQLQELAAADATKTYKLMMWMNANSLALAVIEWESRLAPELIEKPPVCIALADAYARAADWKGLKARIENATWGDMEFMRFAFLARTLERLDDPTGETAAWSNSLNAAQTRADWLEMLARLIQDWSWKQRSEEVLWKLAATDRCPRWAADFLWSAALAREDSAKLYEAAKLLVKLDPKSIVARNNYIFLALATDQTTDSPNDMAAALFKQNPKDVLIATTYGFSLFQQGKTAAAVAVMDAFSPEEVGNPQSALDYAIFLAAAGKMERAEEYFRIGAKSVTLPKERALVAFLAPACRAKLRQQSGDAAGAEAAWKEALAAAEARPEWVEMLGKMAIDWKWSAAAETVALKLASLERCPVWAAEALWTAATKTGDTAQIYRAGRLVGKVDPANLEVRNRYLGVALLGGHELEATQRQAAALARENPRSVELAATHGLALYQQGRADEALALMNSFTAEQLHQPSIALYQGLFLAATGRKSEAEPFLQIAGNAPLLREEKVLATQARDAKPPAPKPAAAPPVAAAAPPPIEPIDRTRRDTAQLFKDSREALLADPKNVTARSNYILLALLTDQSADSARQLARALYKEHAGDAAVAACYGLSLDQQGKTEEAIAAMETLKPEQLREPVVALYYGHFLAGSERAEKSALAPEFLALAEKAPLLPEERALLAKGKK